MLGAVIKNTCSQNDVDRSFWELCKFSPFDSPWTFSFVVDFCFIFEVGCRWTCRCSHSVLRRTFEQFLEHRLHHQQTLFLRSLLICLELNRIEVTFWLFTLLTRFKVFLRHRLDISHFWFQFLTFCFLSSQIQLKLSNCQAFELFCCWWKLFCWCNSIQSILLINWEKFFCCQTFCRHANIIGIAFHSFWLSSKANMFMLCSIKY